MHPALAETTNGPLFYWNIDGVVGLGGANKFDDVMFVQWCFYKMAKWDPARQIWPTLSKVNINGECSGRPYGPLVETIKTAEALFGWKMDGRVTPIAKSAKFSHMGINYVYLIMIMNIALSKMYPQQYPRLDQFPEFIWRVRDKVTYPFVY